MTSVIGGRSASTQHDVYSSSLHLETAQSTQGTPMPGTADRKTTKPPHHHVGSDIHRVVEAGSIGSSASASMSLAPARIASTLLAESGVRGVDTGGHASRSSFSGLERFAPDSRFSESDVLTRFAPSSPRRWQEGIGRVFQSEALNRFPHTEVAQSWLPRPVVSPTEVLSRPRPVVSPTEVLSRFRSEAGTRFPQQLGRSFPTSALQRFIATGPEGLGSAVQTRFPAQTGRKFLSESESRFPSQPGRTFPSSALERFGTNELATVPGTSLLRFPATLGRIFATEVLERFGPASREVVQAASVHLPLAD